MAEENEAEKPKMPIPELGFGTYGLEGDAAIQATLDALELGYRHIDTADIYNNEVEIGKAIVDSGIPREDIFITTKIWPSNYAESKFPEALESALHYLQTSYVDLLLLHWPPEASEYKSVFELLCAARDYRRQTRYIGVSNFDNQTLKQAVKQTDSIDCHQIELHPYYDRSALIQVSESYGMKINAYCALAGGKVIDDPIIQEIAIQTESSPAAVALRWMIDRGYSVSTTSSKRFHLQENLTYRDIKLSDKQRKRIDKMARPNGSVLD
ncbi:MAG: aldo/keto reductase [Betaproteobacteria bacterium AqS2]|uniref:Aldo/keto reductase n=1 Tax=Candidatus Amphirhobacter heronislandensis TaxID=1732024 RepID=A0A930UET9_9GAMM|nr:aldo/keto reductase [Betaproteobacteria bacterium AqS2]